MLKESGHRILALVAMFAIVLAFAGSASAHGPRHFRADLQPFDDTGVSGKAELQMDEAGRLHVVVHVEGFEPGEHINHIHRNATCSPPGGVLQGLDVLTANAAGMATEKTTLDASSVPNLADRVIAVHATAPSFAIVACGEINPIP